MGPPSSDLSSSNWPSPPSHDAGTIQESLRRNILSNIDMLFWLFCLLPNLSEYEQTELSKIMGAAMKALFEGFDSQVKANTEYGIKVYAIELMAHTVRYVFEVPKLLQVRIYSEAGKVCSVEMARMFQQFTREELNLLMERNWDSWRLLHEIWLKAANDPDHEAPGAFAYDVLAAKGVIAGHMAGRHQASGV